MNQMPTTLDRINPSEQLPDEGSLQEEAGKIFANPQAWLQQEHPMLGGRSPQDCIDNGDEQPVRDILRSIKFVGQT